jgi:arginine repressor
MTSHMLNALCYELLANPGLYQDEIARFMRKRFGIEVLQASISRALKSVK